MFLDASTISRSRSSVWQRERAGDRGFLPQLQKLGRIAPLSCPESTTNFLKGSRRQNLLAKMGSGLCKSQIGATIGDRAKTPPGLTNILTAVDSSIRSHQRPGNQFRVRARTSLRHTPKSDRSISRNGQHITAIGNARGTAEE